MAKQSLTLGPRERRLTLIAVVFIGCWALLSWIVQPLWDRLRDLRLRVDTHTEKLQALQRLFAEAPSIEREYAQYAAYLESGNTAGAQGALLEELEALARRSGVQLNLKPRPGHDGARGGSFEVELDIEGSQESLLTFLDELLRLPWLLAIERLQIATVPAKPGLLRSSLVLQQLSPTRIHADSTVDSR